MCVQSAHGPCGTACARASARATFARARCTTQVKTERGRRVGACGLRVVPPCPTRIRIQLGTDSHAAAANERLGSWARRATADAVERVPFALKGKSRVSKICRAQSESVRCAGVQSNLSQSSIAWGWVYSQTRFTGQRGVSSAAYSRASRNACRAHHTRGSRAHRTGLRSTSHCGWRDRRPKVRRGGFRWQRSLSHDHRPTSRDRPPMTLGRPPPDAAPNTECAGERRPMPHPKHAMRARASCKPSRPTPRTGACRRVAP